VRAHRKRSLRTLSNTRYLAAENPSMIPQVYITSLNEKLYWQYGRNFIESWLKNAALDMVLIVVHEEEAAQYLASHSTANVIPMSLVSDEHQRFKKKFGSFTEAAGLALIPTGSHADIYKTAYNYRFDALRFSFKIFALTKVLRAGLVADHFAWIDADVVCRKRVTKADMAPMFPEPHQIASYLGRSQFPQPNPYSECGFVGYRFSNPDVLTFIEEFESLYLTGDIFSLREWHDSYIFDVLRFKFQENGAEFKNLVEHLPESDHPFMQSALAEFFDHLKGPERKARGYSM